MNFVDGGPETGFRESYRRGSDAHAAVGLDGREDELLNSTLPWDFRYLDSKPVFFGQYWLKVLPK